MTAIAFEFRGNPKALQRARAAAIGGHARIYDTKDNVKNKAEFAALARMYAPDTVISGPVTVEVGFHLPRPKGHYGTGRNAGALKAWAKGIGHIKKPDLDNLVKLVKDALIGVFWRDDSQVVEIQATKRYSETPRTVVCVTYTEPQDKGV